MASTLEMSYARLLERIGDFLGLGRDSAAWSTEDQGRVQGYLRSGYRHFLYPATLGQPYVHEWSFLRPMDSIETEAEVYLYDMDEDFAGLVGDVTYDPDDGWSELVRVPEGQIRSLRQGGEVTGRPNRYAMRWKSATGESVQLAEMLLWPTPDAAYTLNFPKQIVVNALDATYTIPLGGPVHSETVLELCLRASELGMDDERGIHHETALELLQASIAHDKRLSSARTLGYNADHSDRGDWSRQSRINYPVTVGGVTPT